MTGVLLKKLLLAGSYLIAAFLVEMLTFLLMGFGAFPEYVLLDIACMLIVAALIYIIPSFVAQAAVIIALLALQCLLSVVNELLYDLSGYVLVLSMFNLAGEATRAFNIDYLNFYLIGAFVLLLSAEIAYCVAVCRRVRVKHPRRGQTVVLALFLALLVGGVSECLYFSAKSSFTRADSSDPLYIYKDDNYLYTTQFISAKALKTFGTFSFYYKNIANFIADVEESNLTEEDTAERVAALDEYFSGGQTSSSLENLDLTPYGGSDQIMTGMLDGQNIVLIVIESGEWYGINATYTPTLYALADQGVSMINYTTRDKTNHSEAMSIFGSYPSEDRNTVDHLLDNTFPFTLPSIVQSDGYTTNYFHANVGSYYDRDLTFGTGLYGFENAHFLDTSPLLNGYYEKNSFYDFDRDSEMISQYLDEFTYTDGESDLFYTQMMTLISHGSYNDFVLYGDYSADWSEEEKAAFSEQCTVKDLEVYYERISDYPAAGSYIDEKFALDAEKTETDEATEEEVPTDVYLRYKRYQAGLMDLDVGVNRLLHELQESGELDNTTFVFYADHNCYYTDQQYALKDIEVDTVWDLRLYNIPFFFWSGKYMDLTVSSSLYNGVEYAKDDLTEEMMEKGGVTAADYYDGEFYYTIDHSATDDSYSFLAGKRIGKFCNSFDLLPTILDLLGYEYNLNLYQGVSVFDAPQSVFVSRESGMYNDHIYTTGEQIFIRAEVNENGSVQAEGGKILFFTDGEGVQRVTIWNEFGEATYRAEDIAQYVYVQDGFVVYEVGAIFSGTEGDRRELLSADVYEFLVDLSAYYEKQEQLEEMFFLDYFRYADISDFVRKTA